MILNFNYEELTALKSGAHTLLGHEEEGDGRVLAPPAERALVEDLLPRLEGDMSLASLHELRTVERAVQAIVECLRAEMESVVVATHPADEHAVASYFEFAHGLTVEYRLAEMAAEMTAMIEVVTGEPPTPRTSRSFHFPD